MFHYNKLKIETHSEVYDPAEDTFLMLGSIDVSENDDVFEIGTGTGIIALACAQKGANVLCSDINPFSIEITKQNYEKNKLLLKGSLEIREGNLFSVLKENEKFDVIIFNPPYLPTKKNEKVEGWYNKALDGGIDGLDSIERFLKELHKYLKKDGKAYFIFTSLSNRKKLDAMIKKASLVSTIVSSQQFNNEIIDVYLVKIKK